MKRIYAIFNEKLEEVKKERKIKRILRTIDIAMDNAEEEKESIENKIEDLVYSLPKHQDLNSFLQTMSDLMGEKEEQENIVTRLNQIKSYLEEEVTTD